MKRFTFGLVWIGLFIILLLTVKFTLAEQQVKDPKNNADQLKQLQEERVKVLTQLVKVMVSKFESGQADFRQYFIAEKELIDAKLEMADKPAERIAYLEEQFKLVKSSVELEESRFRTGMVGMDSVDWAKALSLKIQIMLLKEKQKL